MRRRSRSHRHLGAAFLVIALAIGALPNWDTLDSRPEPDRVVLACDSHADSLPAGAVARFGTQRWRHPGTPWSVQFIPGRHELISAGADGTIIVWDTATGQSRYTIGEHAHAGAGLQYAAVAVSPDGRTVAIGPNLQNTFVNRGWDRTEPRICLRDIAKSTKIQEIWPRKSGSVQSMAFSPDGATLAAASDDGELFLWDVGESRERAKVDLPVKGTSRAAYLVDFTSDSKTVVVGIGFNWSSQNPPDPDGAGEIRVFDASDGKELRRFVVNPKGYLTAMTVSPDGRYAAVLCQHAALWDLARGQKIRELAPNMDVRGFAWSPDGQTLAVGCWNRPDPHCGAICLLDPRTGQERMRLKGYGRSLAFSTDGLVLATSGLDSAIRLWSTQTGQQLFGENEHCAEIRCLAFDPACERLATAADGGAASVRNLHTGQHNLRQILLDNRYEGFGSIGFGPAGNVLATARSTPTDLMQSRAALVWEFPSGKQLVDITATNPSSGGHPVCPVTLSPDGRWLAYGSSGVTEILAVQTGQSRLRLPKQEGEVYGIWFSGDGGKLATCCSPERAADRNDDPIVRLWDVETGALLQQICDRQLSPFALSFDGRIAAIGDRSSDVHFWDMVAGRKLHAAKTNGFIETLAFAPDGLTLVGGDRHGNLHLWDVASGSDLCMRQAHRAGVTALAFDRAGRLLASGSVDTTILLWDTRALPFAKPPPPAVISPVEVEQLWCDLAGDDAIAAQRAMRRLVAGAEQTVPYLGGRLQPALFMPRAQIDLLVPDLDSEEYAVRQRATDILSKQGERGARALRDALAKAKPSLEFRRRAETLLTSLEAYIPSSEALRSLRAVAVLEGIDNAEARRVLDNLAAGAPEAWLTREAQAALDRLCKQA